jgi:zinc protease
VTRQTYDTYVSDVLLFLLSSPSGPFKSSIMKKVYGLYDADYIEFVYPTSRDGGNYIFSTLMLAQKPDTDEPILQRVEELRKTVQDEFARIAEDPRTYFGGDEALEVAKTKLIDQNIYALESTKSFVTGTLTFWWATASTDYFFKYEENCRSVRWEDIAALIKNYLVGEEIPVATLVRVRTSTFSADPRMGATMEQLGYTLVSAENAFWWQIR